MFRIDNLRVNDCEVYWESIFTKEAIDAWREPSNMSGMSGASMLRTRRKDVNLKPNRKLDRKSSRGMLYENEELRLRTININAEVERGQSDIKKLKRENEQLKREISALRYEYDRLDKMLRERRSSPEQSDDAVSVCSKASKCPERKSKSNFGIVTMTNYNDSVSICSACPECTSETHSRTVAFHDLSVVPEVEEEGNRSLGVVQEVEEESIESGVESPCNCDECQNEFQSQPKTNNNPSKPIIPKNVTQPQNNGRAQPNMADNIQERSVDVLVHDSSNVPNFFQSVTTPYHVAGPPPPGFVIAPCEPPRFHTGGNIDDLLGDVQSCPNSIQTTFIQQNSVFMCNMKRIMQKQCCCHKNESPPQPDIAPEPTPKCYVTEKNIELTYDYPRATPIPSSPSQKTSSEMQSTTTEVASTVVFVERRIPVKPKKFDFFFRSRSAPVGENEEPIYATVNKLPKRLRRMELANLEKEVAYKTTEPDSSSRTEVTKTDSESQVPPPDDDTSRSEREKSTVPTRPDSPKAKKRKRFSLTFKKRERKRREKKEAKNGAAKNGGVTTHHHTEDNERLIEGEVQEPKHKHCIKHRPRNTLSSASSGPRYKRDSYQEMTTSHSEHERTNSVCSSVNSLASACTHKSRKLSVAPQDGSIPWCGCWGAGCV